MVRTALKFVVILTLVCTLMGSGVAVLYGLWESKIASREAAARRAAIRAAVPEGAAVDTEHPVAGQVGTESAVYAAKDAAGKTVAYVAGGAAQGYASTVRVVVGAVPTDQGLTIHTVIVTAQAETPGLGARVAEHRSTYTLWQKLFGADEPERRFNPFLDRFKGKTRGEVADVQAITAATITSNAVKAAVAQALGRIHAAAGKS